MLLVLFSCGLLVALTTALHYEVLRGLNAGLPLLTIPKRTKLLVVIIVAFVAHAAEMAMYGVALYALDSYLGGGGLSRADRIFHWLLLYSLPRSPTPPWVSAISPPSVRCVCLPVPKP